MPDALRVVSYGGGVQSTALLVLAARGQIDFRTFLFANVGVDSEHPATLRYLDQYARPYAAAHGIALHELRRIRRDGTTETLHGRLTRPGSRSLPIPVRMANGAPGTRSCTVDFKIKVIARWLKRHGASAENPATTALGISLDEIDRAKGDRPDRPYEHVVYPLLDMPAGTGIGQPLRRADCERIITNAGLPVPGKSACYFCPLAQPHRFAELRRDHPDLFERAAVLEDLLNHRRAELRRHPVYLTRFNRPLRDAIPEAPHTLFHDQSAEEFAEDIGCDGGACWT